jgi:hypothetical protein
MNIRDGSKTSKKLTSEIYRKIGLSASIIFLIYVSKRPLSGFHAFRHAQTIWPVQWWIENGFSPFNPVIPVKGTSHQTWILELPVYQWLVYLISQTTLLSPVIASRLLALALALFAVKWLSRKIADISKFKESWIFLFLIINPYFIYWGTTGLVDWLAISFTLIGSNLYLKTRGVERSKFLLYFTTSNIFLISACLTKPTHFLFALCLVVLFQSESTNLSIRKLAFDYFTPVSISLVTYFVWKNWTSNLYPVGDPRRIWSVISENNYWYFGNEDQYRNLVANLSIILERFTFSFGGLYAFCALLVLFSSTKLKFTTKIGLIMLSMGYLAIFINLNLVHNYYQIPVYFSFAVIVTLSLGRVFEITKENKFLDQPVALLISVIICISFTTKSENYQYIEMALNPKSVGVKCLSEEKDFTVVTFHYEDPSKFFNCGYPAFMINTNNRQDMDVFSREYQNYKILYSESEGLENALTQMKYISEFELRNLKGNWYEIIWRN